MGPGDILTVAIATRSVSPTTPKGSSSRRHGWPSLRYAAQCGGAQNATTISRPGAVAGSLHDPTMRMSRSGGNRRMLVNVSKTSGRRETHSLLGADTPLQGYVLIRIGSSGSDQSFLEKLRPEPGCQMPIVTLR